MANKRKKAERETTLASIRMVVTDLSSSSSTLLLSIKQNSAIPTSTNSHFSFFPSKSPPLFNSSLFLSKNAAIIRPRFQVFSQTPADLELATKVGQDRLLKVGFFPCVFMLLLLGYRRSLKTNTIEFRFLLQI